MLLYIHVLYKKCRRSELHSQSCRFAVVVQSWYSVRGANSCVVEIDLGSNAIGDVGARSLAAALRRNETLAKLALRLNSIFREGAYALAQTLVCNSSITELDITANSIGGDGGLALVDALQSNVALRELHVASNKIGGEAARALAAALARNRELRDLWRTVRLITQRSSALAPVAHALTQDVLATRVFGFFLPTAARPASAKGSAASAGAASTNG